MKKRNLLLSLIVVTALLLVGTVTYSLLRGDDPYKYFTGFGDTFDISPDDQQYVFSYYTAGNEAIYQANANGKEVIQLTKPTTVRHHDPKYSPDGTKILFLAKKTEGINSLFVANRDGSHQKQLTTKKIHVSEAIFSPTEDTIYYIGMAAEDFKKAEGETKEGYDLYSTQLSRDNNSKQLTDKDRFSMNSISISPDGKELYYALNGVNSEKLTAYSLENGEERHALISEMEPKEGYGFELSPDGSRLAYTAIAKESLNNSLYTYELFLMDMKNGQTKRLTNLHTNVASPRFFHTSNQIAFFENTKWPTDPAKYALHSLDLGTQKLQKITIAMPNEKPAHWFIRIVDQLANGMTLIVLYTILMGLLTTYQSYFHVKRSYLPAKISLFLAVAVFISSIVVAINVNPWYGIGLGTVAAAIAGSTLIVFAYAFVLNWVRKRR